MSLEASVARFSVISLQQMSRTRSCKTTAAKEFRPDDIVLSHHRTMYFVRSFFGENSQQKT